MKGNIKIHRLLCRVVADEASLFDSCPYLLWVNRHRFCSQTRYLAEHVYRHETWHVAGHVYTRIWYLSLLLLLCIWTLCLSLSFLPYTCIYIRDAPRAFQIHHPSNDFVALRDISLAGRLQFAVAVRRRRFLQIFHILANLPNLAEYNNNQPIFWLFLYFTWRGLGRRASPKIY
jgi:hypothetical protein